jgi:hypothetical protein
MKFIKSFIEILLVRIVCKLIFNPLTKKAKISNEFKFKKNPRTGHNPKKLGRKIFISIFAQNKLIWNWSEFLNVDW